ncbi:MAG: site-specific DNA-methyltransferase [bacterium]|nr:site-specific DNA-methyltransferase [bacterium]
MMTALVDQFFNEDCIAGCRNRIPSNTVDLIVTDPPYGIGGESLHKHYNRKEAFVLEGYREVPAEDYATFSRDWIGEAARVLRPGGSLYIVSGYTNLVDILNALCATPLVEMNHLIWKYNFGVYTKTKFVSSHYHILYYVKPGKKHTFHTFCRYGANERTEGNGSLNYLDREDVWIINREYKPGKVKNKNELPHALLTKILQYSSREGDLVCDLFLGGFSTAIVAKGLNRQACGFEISPPAFQHGLEHYKKTQRGELLNKLRPPVQGDLFNQGQPWAEPDLQNLAKRYQQVIREVRTKKRTIEILTKEFGRGRFALVKALKKGTDGGST